MRSFDSALTLWYISIIGIADARKPPLAATFGLSDGGAGRPPSKIGNFSPVFYKQKQIGSFHGRDYHRDESLLFES